jgi:hypothetical protein
MMGLLTQDQSQTSQVLGDGVESLQGGQKWEQCHHVCRRDRRGKMKRPGDWMGCSWVAYLVYEVD